MDHIDESSAVEDFDNRPSKKIKCSEPDFLDSDRKLNGNKCWTASIPHLVTAPLLDPSSMGQYLLVVWTANILAMIAQVTHKCLRCPLNRTNTTLCTAIVWSSVWWQMVLFIVDCFFFLNIVETCWFSVSCLANTNFLGIKMFCCCLSIVRLLNDTCFIIIHPGISNLLFYPY